MKKILLAFILLLFCVQLIAQTEKPIKEKDGIPMMEEAPEMPVWDEVMESQPEPVSPKTGIHIFEKGKFKGLKDYGSGKIILEAKYSKIDDKFPHVFIVREGYKTGLYDIRKMKFMIPIEYSSIRIRETRDALAGKNYQFTINSAAYKRGYIDKDYQLILEPIYDNLEVSDNRIIYKKDTLSGVKFLNGSGQDIPMIYRYIQPIGQEKMLAFHHDTKKTLFDKKGKPVFENYNVITHFSGRWESRNAMLYLVMDDAQQTGIYDMTAKQMIIPKSYKMIWDRFFDLYIVQKEDKFGLIDQNNNIQIPLKYDTIAFLKPLNDTRYINDVNDKEKYKNTLLLVSQKGKFGLINRAGEKITKIEYDEVDHIYGFYKVKAKNQYFVLNPAGQKITNLSFDEVGHFYQGKCVVFKDGKMGYLKSGGTMAEDFERSMMPKGYKTIEALYENFVIALKSEEDKALEDFSRAISVDQYSLEFMKRVGLEYRGIPNRMVREGYSLDDLSRKYYDSFLNFKNKLKARGELESLVFIRYSRRPAAGIPYAFMASHYGVMAIEEPGVLKTNSREFEYKLGELVNIDGYWKSFSVPRRL